MQGQSERRASNDKLSPGQGNQPHSMPPGMAPYPPYANHPIPPPAMYSSSQMQHAHGQQPLPGFPSAYNVMPMYQFMPPPGSQQQLSQSLYPSPAPSPLPPSQGQFPAVSSNRSSASSDGSNGSELKSAINSFGNASVAGNRPMVGGPGVPTVFPNGFVAMMPPGSQLGPAPPASGYGMVGRPMMPPPQGFYAPMGYGGPMMGPAPVLSQQQQQQPLPMSYAQYQVPGKSPQQQQQQQLFHSLAPPPIQHSPRPPPHQFTNSPPPHQHHQQNHQQNQQQQQQQQQQSQYLQNRPLPPSASDSFSSKTPAVSKPRNSPSPKLISGSGKGRTPSVASIFERKSKAKQQRNGDDDDTSSVHSNSSVKSFSSFVRGFMKNIGLRDDGGSGGNDVANVKPSRAPPAPPTVPYPANGIDASRSFLPQQQRYSTFSMPPPDSPTLVSNMSQQDTRILEISDYAFSVPVNSVLPVSQSQQANKNMPPIKQSADQGHTMQQSDNPIIPKRVNSFNAMRGVNGNLSITLAPADSKAEESHVDQSVEINVTKPLPQPVEDLDIENTNGNNATTASDTFAKQITMKFSFDELKPEAVETRAQGVVCETEIVKSVTEEHGDVNQPTTPTTPITTGPSDCDEWADVLSPINRTEMKDTTLNRPSALAETARIPISKTMPRGPSGDVASPSFLSVNPVSGLDIDGLTISQYPSTRSLDRSMGRNAKSKSLSRNQTSSANPGSASGIIQNIMHEDVLQSHHNVNHLFWVDRGVGQDFHPSKLLADALANSDVNGTGTDDGSISGDIASLSLLRKRSMLGKIVDGVSGVENVEETSLGDVAHSGSLSRTRSFKESHVVITAVEDKEESSKEDIRPDSIPTGQPVISPTSSEAASLPRQSSPLVPEIIVSPSIEPSKAENSRNEKSLVENEEPIEEPSRSSFQFDQSLLYDHSIELVPQISKLPLENQDQPDISQSVPQTLEVDQIPSLEPVSPSNEHGLLENDQKKGWNWLSNLMPAKKPKKEEIAVAAERDRPDGDKLLSTIPLASMDISTSQSPSITDSEDKTAYPHQDAQFDGFPRFPLHIEKAVYQLSHAKLAQPSRPLIHQVMISNLMLYILSVHADVTLQRQGPRKSHGKKKKGSKKKKKRMSKQIIDSEGVLIGGDSVDAVDQIKHKGLSAVPPLPLVVLTTPGEESLEIEYASIGQPGKDRLDNVTSDYMKRRRRRSSDASITSVDSDSSWTSASESDREGEVAPAVEQGKISIFGQNGTSTKKASSSSSHKSGKGIMGLYRVIGRGGQGRKKSDADDDDVPLAMLKK